MPSESQTILDLVTYYDNRWRDGTLVDGGYSQALQQELWELDEAKTPRQVCDEYGDVLANAILLGVELGFRDPLSCAQRTLDKVARRIAYIEAHITCKPFSPGYHDEFGRLWEESKLERTNDRDANLSSTDPSVVAGTDTRKDNTASG